MCFFVFFAHRLFRRFDASSCLLGPLLVPTWPLQIRFWTPKFDPKRNQNWDPKKDLWTPEDSAGNKTLKGTAENEDWVSLTVLDVSWASLRPLLGSLGFSWTLLGVSWATLGLSWARLGHSWGSLGALLAASWALLGSLGPTSLGLSCLPLGFSWALLGLS